MKYRGVAVAAVIGLVSAAHVFAHPSYELTGVWESDALDGVTLVLFPTGEYALEFHGRTMREGNWSYLPDNSIITFNPGMYELPISYRLRSGNIDVYLVLEQYPEPPYPLPPGEHRFVRAGVEEPRMEL